MAIFHSYVSLPEGNSHLYDYAITTCETFPPQSRRKHAGWRQSAGTFQRAEVPAPHGIMGVRSPDDGQKGSPYGKDGF
jgi:hypothetical protein